MSPRRPPTVDRRAKAEPQRLSRQLQVRFTDQQYGWLVAVAEATGRPLGALARDVVTVWCLNKLRDDGETINLDQAIAELEQLGDAE